jgi:hypothetical protein
MIEFLVLAGIAGAAAGAVACGITVGSRYVDAKLRYEEKDIRTDQPILAPQIRHGARVGGERTA